MPVYNDERFVGAAIQSILVQSYSDFELIVVNDGSTDGTVGVLETFYDSRIHVVHQTNQGVVRSLNRAIALSRGKYIARMDSDDISHPDRFRIQMGFLERNPECGMVGSACEIIGEDGSHLSHFKVPLTDNEIRYAMVWKNPIVHSSIMIRKSILDRVSGYDQNIHGVVEDYDLWFKVLAITHVANLEDELVKRTHRKTSTFRIRKSLHYMFMFRIQYRALRRGYTLPWMLVSLGRTMCYFTVHRIMEGWRGITFR